jgi:hypothetical protein
VKNIFPLLLAIAQRLVQEAPENEAAGEMLKTILKTYLTAIQVILTL